MVKKTDTKLNKLGVAAVFLLLAYAFGSWAVDSGSLWHYLGAIVFFILTVKALISTFKIHGKK